MAIIPDCHNHNLTEMYLSPMLGGGESAAPYQAHSLEEQSPALRVWGVRPGHRP
jgi:hypothetical protein